MRNIILVLNGITIVISIIAIAISHRTNKRLDKMRKRMLLRNE